MNSKLLWLKHLKRLIRLAVLTGTLLSAVTQTAPVAFAAGAKEATDPANTRNFYLVLDELLSDFEADLKQGQVVGLKDLSIRNVVTSENVPPSFRSHLELLVSERILKVSKTRLVHCLACRSKKATLTGDSMLITSSENNAAEMQRIAKMNGIQNLMDIAYAYQPSGMILSLSISDVESGTTLWSRSYNSQTTRAAAKRKGVEYNSDSANDDMRMEYQPTIQIRPTLYTVIAPKAGSGSATALGFGLRMTEKYDNRQKEVGFELNYYYDTAALTGQPGAKNDKTNLYANFNLTMLFIHGWNLNGSTDNNDRVRGTVFTGLGGTYASGFLGALIRVGYDWHLAKHWSVTAFGGYRPKSTLVVNGTTTAPLSGAEGGLGVGFIF